MAVIYAVMTLMYFGRGDFENELEFLEHYTQLSARSAKIEWDIGHMLNKLPLAYYLEQGLALAAELGIDVDGLLQT